MSETVSTEGAASINALLAAQARRVEALEARLEALEARLEALEERTTSRARGAEDRLADLEQWCLRLEREIEHTHETVEKHLDAHRRRRG
jgi:hypothetical protein